MRISLRWTTMPIPDKGATFAFKANITRHEFLQLIEDNNLDFDVYKECSKDVYIVGHKNATDHIATYVPDIETLYTSTREAFKENSCMDMYDTFTAKFKLYQLIKMLGNWREDAEQARGKKIDLDVWAINMLIGRISEIEEEL